MYIKTIRKYCVSEKTTHTYYRLSESYRDEFGISRQRMVLGLGQLHELPDFDDKILFLERLNELIKGKPTLFSCKDEKIEQLAQHFYGQLKQKRKIDTSSHTPEDIDTVKLNTLKNKNIREIGAESLCYQALKQLGIDTYLKSRGWSEIIRIMNTQNVVTTTVENQTGDTIQIRQSSELTQEVRQICSKLKYNDIPLKRKKSVWHTGGILKNEKSHYHAIMDG
ncbi:hypothetical protein GX865_04460 [Candidatus Saccharibacteria bacterium]|nr:hypothetical protein [Candidatus Saccharibacteria bacterium]